MATPMAPEQVLSAQCRGYDTEPSSEDDKMKQVSVVGRAEGQSHGGDDGRLATGTQPLVA
ncbi:MAG: hypothetical protein ACYCS2_06850 [Acidimicrobiales bacterium]